MPFVLGGVSDGDASIYEADVIAGVGFGFNTKHRAARDLLALAVGWGRPSDGALQDQYTSGVFYRFQLVERLALRQPSTQGANMMNGCKIGIRRSSLWSPLMSVLGLALAPVLGVAVPGDAAAEVSMTTGNGRKMTLALKTLPDARGYIYCELVFDYGDAGMDIYSTSPLAPCSLKWWETLDLEALAREFGAASVVKNGPQRWSMDEVGVMVSEPVSVAGVKMVFGAHLPGGTLETGDYQVFNPAKTQNLVWKAGEPAYQLVGADGHVYVVQGYKVETESLATLGDRFQKLPEGWEYRVEVLAEGLVMNLTPNEAIPSVRDEFDQIYIRIPE